MPKGYLIGGLDVVDTVGYIPYTKANGPALAALGARFLVRGGDFDYVEGIKRHRHVVVEFPSYEAALAAYQSDAYQKVIALRRPYAIADVAIVEGYDGEQPCPAAPVASPELPLGYWIVRMDITDPERYARYRAAKAEVLREYGGWILVNGGRSQILEGTGRGAYVVVAFKDMHAARACFESYAYASARVIQAKAAAVDMVIIGGYGGPTGADTPV